MQEWQLKQLLFIKTSFWVTSTTELAESRPSMGCRSPERIEKQDWLMNIKSSIKFLRQNKSISILFFSITIHCLPLKTMPNSVSGMGTMKKPMPYTLKYRINLQSSNIS